MWMASSGIPEAMSAMAKAGIPTRQELIWYKSQFVLGRQDYQWRHEPCLYGWKGEGHYFTPERTLSTIFDDSIDYEKLSKSDAKEILLKLIENLEPSVLKEKKPSANFAHPTMKPVLLMARLMRNSSRPGEAVLDPFGGSGSTLLAAQQIGRRCFTCELDEKYCDVILARWEELTGEVAELVNRGE